MATVPKLSVEQSSVSFVLLGDCPFTSELTAAFEGRGVTTSPLVQSADYCLIWGEVDPPPHFSGRLIFIHPYNSWPDKLISLQPACAGRADKLYSSRHLYLGSIFGANQPEPFLAGLCRTANEQGQLIIPGDGIGKYHLLTLADALTGIVTATIHPRGRGVIYFPGIEYSLLSLTHHLRSYFPRSLEVTFNEDEEWPEPAIPWDEVQAGYESLHFVPAQSEKDLHTYLTWLVDNIPIPKPPIIASPEKLKSLPADKLISPRLTKFTPPPASRPKRTIEFEPIKPLNSSPKLISFRADKLISSFRLPRRLSHLLIILGISLGLYLSSLLIACFVLFVSLNSLRSSFAGTATPHLTSGEIASKYLQMNAVAWNTLPFGRRTTTDLVKLLDGVNQSFPLAANLWQLKNHSWVLAQYLLGEGEGSQAFLSSLNQSRLLVESIYDQLSLLQGTLPTALPATFPARFNTKYQSLASSLLSVKKATLTGKALLSILPDLVGVGGRRQYALLLQNNMELRPTGGFIGSFALISLDQGRLVDLPVYDVYQADGQLKGHVEPPVPIRKYLGEANWYLRDSNWDPDFPTTATRVDWYLKKTLNQDVDGVIGINLNVIESLLRHLGPVQVPEYDEEITADNLYGRTEYHAEVGFFPGSTQKKEFLSALTEAIMARLRTLDTATLMSVGAALLDSADHQDLTIYVDSPASQSLITRLGWDGALKAGSCNEVACLSDYLSVVDANVGVNKANYFSKRQFGLEVTLDNSGRATHTLTVDQTNLAESSSWPAGAYKNYQRLYLPPGAELVSLSKDGATIPSRDIDLSSEHGKTVLGYLVTTPVAGKSRLVATYRLPAVGSFGIYNFYWQKQPGTAADPLTITLQYPPTLTPSVISPAGETGNNQLIFRLDNSSDHRILVNFARQ